jgi:hypothetical protein
LPQPALALKLKALAGTECGVQPFASLSRLYLQAAMQRLLPFTPTGQATC